MPEFEYFFTIFVKLTVSLFFRVILCLFLYDFSRTIEIQKRPKVKTTHHTEWHTICIFQSFSHNIFHSCEDYGNFLFHF